MKSEQHAAAILQALAEQALEKRLIADAVIAQSAAQSRALWTLRESISEAQAREGKEHQARHIGADFVDSSASSTKPTRCSLSAFPAFEW
jgi:FAD/FMN-containing dehydrogenase